ncbi:MAG: hypothetical protein GC129_07175 [Proteobacteria bacterium]|nr:hypothetical protein [Pseudomonadota bacterium]
MKTLVCLGDSLVEGEGDMQGMEGWVGRLRQRLLPDTHPQYAADYHSWGMEERHVYNLGIAGDTIRDIDLRLGEVLARRPDVLIIGCCVNDITRFKEADGFNPHLPLYHRERFWPIVLKNAKNICPKVLVTPGAFLERDFVDVDGNGPLHEDFVEHVALIERTCGGVGVEFLPVPESFARDEWRSHDLHWNAKGYEQMTGLVYDKLNALKWI